MYIDSSYRMYTDTYYTQTHRHIIYWHAMSMCIQQYIHRHIIYGKYTDTYYTQTHNILTRNLYVYNTYVHTERAKLSVCDKERCETYMQTRMCVCICIWACVCVCGCGCVCVCVCVCVHRERDVGQRSMRKPWRHEPCLGCRLLWWIWYIYCVCITYIYIYIYICIYI